MALGDILEHGPAMGGLWALIMCDCCLSIPCLSSLREYLVDALPTACGPTTTEHAALLSLNQEPSDDRISTITLRNTPNTNVRASFLGDLTAIYTIRLSWPTACRIGPSVFPHGDRPTPTPRLFAPSKVSPSLSRSDVQVPLRCRRFPSLCLSLLSFPWPVFKRAIVSPTLASVGR